MVSNSNLKLKSSCLEIRIILRSGPWIVIEEREACMVWRFWTGETMNQVGSGPRDRQQRLRITLSTAVRPAYHSRMNSFLMPNNISRSTAVAILQQPQLVAGGIGGLGQRMGTQFSNRLNSRTRCKILTEHP